MGQLFTPLLILHILGGSAGLITGTIAASVKKGSKPHLVSGKIFFWGMFLASSSALVLSWIPGHESLFLFAVGGFTLYMILSGYRIVLLKRKSKQHNQTFFFNRLSDHFIWFFICRFFIDSVGERFIERKYIQHCTRGIRIDLFELCSFRY